MDCSEAESEAATTAQNYARVVGSLIQLSHLIQTLGGESLVGTNEEEQPVDAIENYEDEVEDENDFNPVSY